MYVPLGALHKRRLLKRGGRGGQKCRNLLSKKTTKGDEGRGHKIEKMGRRRLWIAPKNFYVNVIK